ncbi:MAG: tRNA (adenosine(37)-N6)-threonylcarbamoyltransferase complex transferase subunit TsaD [Verrucomicrobiae bacterium]|nr:tRNA (adenosine(37)-N6)-threonylcarbamoyltransferase complex transferase subunit TsaD [Verrucomicrobiae bacterium]
MPTVLAIETSCDETSAAVVCEGRVCSNVVSSQMHIHAEHGGVVPELAVREHLRNLPVVVREALQRAGVTPGELELIAATRGPGLPTALMAGLKLAQGMAFALNKPLVGVHHHEAHLYSPWIGGQPPVAQWGELQPNVSLIVSGGHTLLVWVQGPLQHQVLGSTVDDAAGECFDKTAKMLGLPYPGGPLMDRLAAQGDPRAFDFPRPMLNEDHDDFSFSGLKTSVRYFLDKQPGLADDPQQLRNLCASVQAAIVETLVGKTVRAARRCRVKWVTASGGVTCNRSLRRELARACAAAGLGLRLAAPEYCADNAAMIGVLAEQKWRRAPIATDWDADISPRWDLVAGEAG